MNNRSYVNKNTPTQSQLTTATHYHTAKTWSKWKKLAEVNKHVSTHHSSLWQGNIWPFLSRRVLKTFEHDLDLFLGLVLGVTGTDMFKLQMRTGRWWRHRSVGGRMEEYLKPVYIVGFYCVFCCDFQKFNFFFLLLLKRHLPMQIIWTSWIKFYKSILYYFWLWLKAHLNWLKIASKSPV